MRILVVSPKFHPVVGGGETFALDAVEQLHAKGITIAVAAEPHPIRNIAMYKYPFYEVNGLSDSSLNPTEAADGLFKLLNEFKPTIIHAHGYFALLALGLCNHKNIPIVASIHSTPVWGSRIVGGMSGFEQEVIFAEKILALSRPKVITAANQVYAAAAEKLVAGSIPIAYMPYPILPDFFEQQDRTFYRDLFKLNDKDILITVPSRIIERKGIREAVDAMQALADNHYLCLPSASEPLDKKYWQEIIGTDAYKRVRHRIIIPDRAILHHDMPKLYAATDIVLMPSYYEGAPVATVEAMAAKKPFIGADSQGINGFITNNKNGLLIPKKDSKSIAEAINRLSSDPSLQVVFTEAASKSVAELTWKVQLPRLITILEDSSSNKYC